MADLVTYVNLLLCVIILALAFFCYWKSKDWAPVLIGLGFGLFGISHVASIADYRSDALIAVRVGGYLLVIVAMLMLALRGMKAPKPAMP